MNAFSNGKQVILLMSQEEAEELQRELFHVVGTYMDDAWDQLNKVV